MLYDVAVSLQHKGCIALLCTDQGMMPVILYVALHTLLIRKACNEALFSIEGLQLSSCWDLARLKLISPALQISDPKPKIQTS